MSQVQAIRERIGDMLVASGLVSAPQLEEALAAQRRTGARLGKQLVQLGYVSELQLAQTLSNQLAIPWVSLDRIEFSRELLARIPAELAERHTLMPVYVRSVRGQGDTLYVAMEDPTDESTLREVSAAAALPVRAMIAAPGDIRRAIDRHYFVEVGPPITSTPSTGLRDALERAAESAYVAANAFVPPPGNMPPAAARPAAPPAPTVPTASGIVPAPPAPHGKGPGHGALAPEKKPPPPRPPAKPAANTDPHLVPLERYETPSEPPGANRRVLTLLDGTRLAVTPTGSKRFAQEATEVRHVVRTIRAVSADAGIEQAPTWHEVAQIILDAARARGTKLTRKDIAEAYLRLRARLPRASEEG
jgi:type IV pilus assembly protein PilB